MLALAVAVLLHASPETPPLRSAVDLHAHVAMEDAAKPIFHGRSGKGRLAKSPSVVLDNQLEAKTLQASGVRLLVGAVWPPIPIRPGRTDTDEALNQLHKLMTFPDRAAGFVVAKDAATARKLLAGGDLVVLVPGVEGGEGIHSAQDVDRYFAAGMRVLTLVHFVDNDLGTAAPNQLGAIAGFKPGPQPQVGLTAVGRDVVKRLIELGVVIDLAHASDTLTREVLDLTEKAGVPVINTHTGSRTLTEMPRNTTDELAARIVKQGGVVGVTAFSKMVKGAKNGTCDDIVTHWVHLAKAVGAENLTFGSDFNGFVTRPDAGGSCPEGLRHSGDYATWIKALEAAGIPENAIYGQADRFLKVMEAVEAKANPVERAKAEKLQIPSSSVFDTAL